MKVRKQGSKEVDFYVLLGLERSAPLAEIKRAYKRLARRHHPDINPGDRTAAVQFRQIAEAYETLSDPDRRRRYDAGGEASAMTGDITVGFDGFDFSVSASGPSASTFGDLFAELLQQRGVPAEGAPERGTDLHYHMSLGFEEAARGGQQTITVTRQEHCRTCRGLGRLPVAERDCRACHGRRDREVGARPHDLFQAVRVVRRVGSPRARRAVRRAAATRWRSAPSR